MISLLKKKTYKPNYSKETIFKIYTFDSDLLIEYYNAFVKLGAVIDYISGMADYYSDFVRQPFFSSTGICHDILVPVLLYSHKGFLQYNPCW